MSNLTDAEIHALHEALDDEYRAWSTYDQVIADFGEVPPFANIREAEGRHIDAICALFDRYRLPVPANPWPGNVKRYDDLQQARAAGVAAEIANGEIYDRLLSKTQRPDILTVLRNLREASQQRHLAAFRRCAQIGTAEHGRGAGRRRGGRRPS